MNKDNAPFYPGQRVVCVNDRFMGMNGEIIPKLNKRYTVRKVTVRKGDVGVLLEEIINNPQKYSDGFFEIAFKPKRFAPVPPKYENISHELAQGVSIGDTTDWPVKILEPVNN